MEMTKIKSLLCMIKNYEKQEIYSESIERFPKKYHGNVYQFSVRSSQFDIPSIFRGFSDNFPRIF